MTYDITARKAALLSLVSFWENGKYSNLEVSSALKRYSFSDAERKLYTRLVYGVIERAVTLDSIIAEYSSRPIEKIDITALTLIRMGLYQILFNDRIPPHAAVCETVELAPRSSKGFVNAVLREFLRRGKKYTVPTDDAGRLSVTYSCPVGLCGFFIEKYGVQTSEKILESSVRKAPVYIRVNTLETSAEELCGTVFADARPVSGVPDMLALDSVIFDTSDGGWFVEDLSSRLAAKVLGAKPGETVVDTCAAPGGKSFSVAIDMKNEGKVYSFDLHENKVSLIRKGAERLGIDIIEAAEADARKPVPELVGKADRVLCDAPCSGLGVIAKKPDIKYKSLDEIKRLPEIQYEVLCGASRYVRSGGTLVYSTCTLNPDENEKVAGRFLEENSEFEKSDFSLDCGASSKDGMLTIFPYDFNSDGFFIARFIKKAD